MQQRLSLVTLGVRDLAQARAFYEDGLGWKPVRPENEGVAFYSLGGWALSLYSREALAEDANLPLGSGFGGITLAYNVRERVDVETVLAEAVAAGATLVKPAKDAFWGGYSGYFTDLDGHPWEVAWNPHWALDDKGHLAL
jgi:catechol 2,3-dioxygenase-like lactoylglutathione lyase family enzyme